LDNIFTRTLHITHTGKKQFISLVEVATELSKHATSKIYILCDAYTQVLFSCAPVQTNIFLSIELVVGTHAQVEFFWQQENLSQEKTALRGSFFLKEQASLKAVFIVNKKNKHTQLDLETVLLEPYAQAYITTLHVLDAEQDYRLVASQIHKAPHTFSRLTTRGIVSSNAKAFCKGVVIIEKQADYADAAQYTKQLVFGSQVRVENLPLLEVHTKKVACKHGSAVGSINLDDLWYLASKGIELETAQAICKEAFLRSALEDSGVDLDTDTIMKRFL
jgi:Fe-S cluster assembly protein SufD